MLKNHQKTAIVYKDKQYSYRSLLQHAACYGEAFQKETAVQKVLIFAENSPSYFFAFYGTMLLKKVVVPVDVQSTAKEFLYIIDDCQPSIIFTTENKRAFVEEILSNRPELCIKVLTDQNIDTSTVDQYPAEDIIIDDFSRTILLLYTSGTTGSPKGVMLCYKNVHHNIKAVCDDIAIFHRDRNVMVLLPLHHVFSLLGTMVAPMHSGSTVYIAEGLTAESILKTLNEGKISIIIGVPRLYDTLAKGVLNKINANFATKIIYKLVKTIGSDTLSKAVFKSVHEKFGGHIKFLVSGGAALSIDTAKVFKALGFYVLEGYGMTEASPMISFTQPGKRKVGYAGQIMNGTEVKLTEYGELCVKGDNIMQGYYNRPEETAAVIKDGWLHTGDVGIIDKYGVKLTGRIKDIIVTPNGKNINPEEIEEEFLNASPAIKEIAIFMNNNVLQAIIVPEMTTIRELSVENIEQYIKDEVVKLNKSMTAYKRIKQVHIYSQELPKTRLGKIQRFKLPALAYKQQRQEETPEEGNHGKIYELLKQFVDGETGYQSKENDHFEIDLSMDSLSRVALLAYIENTFGLVLNENDIEELNTLKKLSKYIENNSNTITQSDISWAEILSSKVENMQIPQAGFTHRLVSFLSKIALNVLYRYRGKGEKNIPQEPCIFVANHRSAIDGIIITARLKRKASKNTFFFAKEKHWRTKFARFMAGKNNIIIMDINSNLRVSLQQLSYVLQQGKNVIIFPEGTRSKDGQMKQFKETFAILSTELNIPVVPVVIKGSEKAAWKKIKLPRFLTRIRVEFLPAIYPKTEQTATELRDNIANIIEQELNTKK